MYSGYIYDENQKAIPEVKIQIVGTDIVTYSDDKGFFSINHKDRGQEILVLKSGYEMQFFTPNSGTEEIELVLKAETGK
jgi:predicted RNA-binding protein associated with RNAse of E/G family